ncbi:ACP S-malonyltransferase [Streptomyces broussonetiae]|uniref:[acyl-carrier-protein] S-malonyltransferase n=1 Tax=Streptomyces broussonetiae TaxID=2686304 RepID=A0A6I6N340_9ACTN|nr:acyltransferase domain-containing protein [Streptomyces broussonetiae]QHA03347.1 acyltransferase domain-containing protein [Streptomyces broussonetiae]
MAHDTALVFPGMGPVPFTEVGRFMVANPFARDLVAVADEALGYSLVDAFRTSPGDYSEAAQVAFFINCLACADWARDHLGVEPDIVAGPSFGEKAALAYTGALELPDAVRLTAEIARCLEEYFAEEHRDIVTLSFVRAPRDGLDAILTELDEAGEWHEISCHIDDGFYMISLSEHRVAWLEERLRSVGSLPLYTMRPPMHASAFRPLRERAERDVVSRYTFADPKLPVVADQDGRLLHTGEELRTMLLDGFDHPMNWPGVTTALKEAGVTRLCVAGPDSLFGRVPCATRNFDVVAAPPRLAMTPRRRSRAA